MADNAAFCGNCGAKAETENNTATQQVNQIPVTQPVYTNMGRSLTEPLSVKDYVIMFLLLMIPIANIILLFVWGFDSSTNLNKSNFAKAYLIMILIGIGLSILSFILIGGFLTAMLAGISGSYNYSY
jgi:uncharacterized membrane protein YvbJ